ncbi:metal-sensitive transcriptional regulator [Propionibacterium australiense]|uniref:CsoR-like_DUF156 n=1 Tax=Propionibacterium australiense TaxID=119981 RepID=A0A383S851_9ACTN|nr:metal-sensitive transcriptional regulator [Propionibacterium australiense]RLP08997.1 transcriptional regulator [Propionibacterium australiense]RLP09069.1 transcriptional regulator [Propionibacterium australiense]SYZ33436.1 CsoR-like_DUF156 [Propionibacterium australiense]VEH91849.1 Copper-sensitive operon repressor [Propionibacterium australiense]
MSGTAPTNALADDDLAAVVRRLQRAQGQLGGIIRMIQEGRDCKDVVTQIAAVSKAVDRAGFAVIAAGLRHCLADPQSGPDPAEMERLFLSLA